MVPWLKLQRCSKVLANLVNLWFSRRYFWNSGIIFLVVREKLSVAPFWWKKSSCVLFFRLCVTTITIISIILLLKVLGISQLWKQQLREKKEREGKEREGKESSSSSSLKRLVTCWNHQAGSMGSEWTFFENLQGTVWELWEKAQRDLELSRRWSSGVNLQWSKLKRQTILDK